MELSGNQRKVLDFLNYSKDDIHWWQAWFNVLALGILTLIFRQNNSTEGTGKSMVDIKFSVIEMFVKHLMGAFLIRQLYFNSKFQFKINTKVVLVLCVIVNCLLLLRYLDLVNKNSKWWASFLLIDITTYFVIFVQMLIEWRTWGSKIIKWRADLAFDEKFRKRQEEDGSETHIRMNIDTMINDLVEEV